MVGFNIFNIYDLWIQPSQTVVRCRLQVINDCARGYKQRSIGSGCVWAMEAYCWRPGREIKLAACNQSLKKDPVKLLNFLLVGRIIKNWLGADFFFN